MNMTNIITFEYKDGDLGYDRLRFVSKDHPSRAITFQGSGNTEFEVFIGSTDDEVEEDASVDVPFKITALHLFLMPPYPPSQYSGMANILDRLTSWMEQENINFEMNYEAADGL